MASQSNFFALLNDDENDDPSVVLSRAASVMYPAKASPAAPGRKQQQQQGSAKFPSKPLPPEQAVRDAQRSQVDAGRGRGASGVRGAGGRGGYGLRGRGREGGAQGDRTDFADRRNISADTPTEDGGGGRLSDGGRGRIRGRGRGRGFGYGVDGGERQGKRDYDRRSGTGRGNEMKRDGSGRGNWGIDVDPDTFQGNVETNVAEEDKPILEEITQEEGATGPINMQETKVEEEDHEMSLEEYEKALNERRKALEAFKPEQRKVAIDKEFESMQLVEKKHDDTLFQKQGLDNEHGRKRDEKVKKSLSINEFLRPATGEEYYIPARRGRGRGRGRGERWETGVVRGDTQISEAFAPPIKDPLQFPTLSARLAL